MSKSQTSAFPSKPDDIIFDWNDVQSAARPAQAFDLNDETLRDGVQSPSVVDPPIEDKFELLGLMSKLGIRAVNIGLPGAGRRAFDDVVAQAKYIAKNKLALQPNCAARTVITDIKPVVEASQASGQKIVLYTFIGSSPIRQWAENWTVDFIEKTSAEAISFAVKEGLEVAYVTEDTTRSSPATLDVLFRSAIEHGASRLVLCDTVGHATPAGVKALVEWTRGLLSKARGQVKLDWHGHNDRGLAITNALAALEAGVDRVHACGLGVGERVGNTSMDQLLLNLKLMGWVDYDLSALVEYVNKVSKSTRVAIPVNYPLSGADAFRTATGVHAAAIIKAKNRGNDWLADRVYSGVPAGEFGLEQVIEVGHMSGMSNVRYWLSKRGYPVTDEVCEKILKRAKSSAWTLGEKEILSLVKPTKGKKAVAKAPRKKPARTSIERAKR
ncbi:MAG: LeuA family protein [Myxococcaceae bacterium]|nr:LeuA family protein [Myxococcaceae bacterium]